MRSEIVLMILVAGNINYDILLPLPAIPGPHEKVTCNQAYHGFGGSAANTAFWLARLGADVRFTGAVGGDELGRSHVEHLRQVGVDVSGIQTTDTTTGIAVVFSLGVGKRMIRVPGANREGRANTALTEGADLLYLSGANSEMLSDMASAAKKMEIPVICGWHGAQDSRIERMADGFIMNSDELHIITGIEEPDDGIRALDSRLAAVTLPTGGCLVSQGIYTAAVLAEELDPVDRTGGGDAFAAGFLAGLERGLGIEKCGEMGNKLAAEVIMGVGARTAVSIPKELRPRV